MRGYLLAACCQADLRERNCSSISVCISLAAGSASERDASPPEGLHERPSTVDAAACMLELKGWLAQQPAGEEGGGASCSGG